MARGLKTITLARTTCSHTLFWHILPMAHDQGAAVEADDERPMPMATRRMESRRNEVREMQAVRVRHRLSPLCAVERPWQG